jgi:hypothetical protein
VIRRYVLLFVVGALLLSLCDRVHLEFGVLVQAGPKLWGQGLWVLPVFGGGAVGILAGYPVIRRALGADRVAWSGARVLRSAILAAAAYVVTGPFAGSPLLLSAGLYGAWLARVILRRSGAAAAYSLVVGVLGPAAEATFSALGLHTYAAPHLVGIPMWLAAIYLHGALLAVDSEALTRRV